MIDKPEEVIMQKLKLDDKHELIAVTVDLHNNEIPTSLVIEICSGKLLTKIINCSQVEFSKDSNAIFYVLNDEHNRPYEVKSHILGEKHEDDVVIHTEISKTNYIDIANSKDGSHLIIASNTKEDSEVWVMP